MTRQTRHYTVSKDTVSGLWYAHMIGYPNIPVAGSFSSRKTVAVQYARMCDGLPHRLTRTEREGRFE